MAKSTEVESFVDAKERVIDMTSDFAVGNDMAAEMAVIGHRQFKDEAEYLTFMEDPITITVSTVSDPNAPLWATAGVNGTMLDIPRGVKVKVRRKFAERLCRSQSHSVSTRRLADASLDDAYQTVRRGGMDYPFEVHHDPSPKGPTWFRRVTQESR